MGTRRGLAAYDSSCVPGAGGPPRGVAMYTWLHWTGVATVAIWAVCSAYFTLHGI
jgi:hypothetical protein